MEEKREKSKRKCTPRWPRKKFDIREIGNSIKKFFGRGPSVKPMKSFKKSKLGKSYKKWYKEYEAIVLEAMVRYVEKQFDPKRPVIPEKLPRPDHLIPVHLRSRSQERTKHDTVEYLRKSYIRLAKEFEVDEEYDIGRDKGYPRPDPSRTVQGSYSQASIPTSVRKSRHLNNQCTSMAYTSILVAKNLPTTLWTPELIDRLLVNGDRLHHRIMDDLKWKKHDCQWLAPDEVPILPHTTRGEWPYKVLPTKQLHGVIRPSSSSQRSYLKDTDGSSLKSALHECFNSGADGCVVTTSSFSTAVIRDPAGQPCVFDSHDSSPTGLGNSGKAALLRFNSIEHCAHFYSKKYGRTAAFNIAGLEVLSRPWSKCR